MKTEPRETTPATVVHEFEKNSFERVRASSQPPRERAMRAKRERERPRPRTKGTQPTPADVLAAWERVSRRARRVMRRLLAERGVPSTVIARFADIESARDAASQGDTGLSFSDDFVELHPDVMIEHVRARLRAIRRQQLKRRVVPDPERATRGELIAYYAGDDPRVWYGDDAAALGRATR